ncbi:sulfite exporter TauE/SafE family protein [Spirosoma knui]
MSPWFITALLTGLISSVHCVGMCGPLVAALPIGRLPHTQRWLAVGLYHAGRITTYSSLGALAGTMGLGLHLLGWQRPLAVICGVVLLIGTVWRSNWATQLRLPRFNQWVTRTFSQHLRKTGWAGFAGLGILNGLLPCGFTYVALAGTLATDTPVAGASYMLFFGLGTLPALLGVNAVMNWLSDIGRQRINRFLSVATVIVALLLISRGLTHYKLPARPTDPIPVCHGTLATR